MSNIVINGGNALKGEITVHGAKNSVLPVLAATVLCKGDCVVHNCPDLSDVSVSVKILEYSLAFLQALSSIVKRSETSVASFVVSIFLPIKISPYILIFLFFPKNRFLYKKRTERSRFFYFMFYLRFCNYNVIANNIAVKFCVRRLHISGYPKSTDTKTKRAKN